MPSEMMLRFPSTAVYPVPLPSPFDFDASVDLFHSVLLCCLICFIHAVFFLSWVLYCLLCYVLSFTVCSIPLCLFPVSFAVSCLLGFYCDSYIQRHHMHLIRAYADVTFFMSSLERGVQVRFLSVILCIIFRVFCFYFFSRPRVVFHSRVIGAMSVGSTI